jgi:uridine nucleosidase
VHGNASLAQTTANAASVLTAIGRADVPVYPGAAKPFCRAAVHAPDIHGMADCTSWRIRVGEVV